MLAVNHIDPAQAPLLLPTHFSLAGSEILLHLARPNGGVRPRIQRVEATFKYDDHNPVDHRERVIGNLEQRDRGLDPGAAVQQRRRLAAIGEWRARRAQP
jgi:hypothetical protein